MYANKVGSTNVKLENQVCSLELSKKLKELGVEQSSLFYYLIGGIVPRIEALPLMGENHYSAFTSDELMEIIFQKNYERLEETGYLEITTEKVYRSTGDFYRITNNLTEHLIDSPKLADCLAELLILAKEQGLNNQ